MSITVFFVFVIRTGAGGIRLEKDEDSLSEEEHIEDDIEEEPEEDDDEEMKKLEKRVAKEEERKKRVDDLWASFKEDTASVRPKRSSVSEKVRVSSMLLFVYYYANKKYVFCQGKDHSDWLNSPCDPFDP